MRNITASLSCMLFSLIFYFPLQSFAAEDARAYISGITTELEAALQEGRQKNLLEDEKYIDAIIDQHIIPNVDKEFMSRRIFRPRWKEIVAQNKTEQAYKAVFDSLRRTYRFALSAYNGRPIDIRNSTVKAKYSVIRIYIHTDDKGHTIDLAVRPNENSWRVFDLSIDGVVVTKTLNSAIKRTLESEDIDSVIAAINPRSES
ncbi:ABC transporter substrate-binding protein [Amphritea sp. HPY]|uniref:ABC transporter substrate-binding protein n=1 Tax=Amphritea sp. HPY TaxID=3421652 RepID=UPI003D7D8128